MKISKVDHTNTAVGNVNNHSKGILYNNPSQNGKVVYGNQDLEKRVFELNRNAQRLYSILNNVDRFSFNPSKDEIRVWKSVKRNFDAVTKSFTFDKKKKNDLLKYIKNLDANFQLKAIDGLSGVCKSDEIAAFISRFVNESVRKSFCKTVKTKSGQQIDLKAVVVRLVWAVSDSNNYKNIIASLSDDAINAFINAWYEDYYKNKQRQFIVKSINNKDTKVQVINDNAGMRLALSSYKNDKKKPLFEFMIEYAAADDERREAFRNEKRRFISDYLESGNSDGIVFSEKIEDQLKRVGATADRNERKELKREALDMLSDELLRKYNDTKASLSSDDTQGYYWLYFFSTETEKWIKDEIRKRNGSSYNVIGRKLAIADLSKHLFKYFLSFLAEKYIDMGKAVYHFTDFSGNQIGRVSKLYRNGITSFDYERITADDNVKRDMATYVSFAINNFANSVCDADILSQDKYEDALGIDLKDEDKFKDDAKMLILRYFGGISSWSSLGEVGKMEIISAFREMLASVRNSTVHFDAAFSEKRAENSSQLIMRIFNEEFGRLGQIYAKKYYSNNLPMFFSKDDIYGIMRTLYNKERIITAGVPAFGRIVARSKTNEFLKSWMGIDNVNRVESISPEMQEKFESAMYFLLKEIYYYGFISDDKLQVYLDGALANIKPKEVKNEKGKVVNANEVNAYKNFKERFGVLKNSGLNAAEICEQIMHDYADQNNDIKEVKTSKNAKDDEGEIYQHFRMLLYKLIKTAFLDFLNVDSKYKSFKSPQNLEETFKDMPEDSFAGKVCVDVCKSVSELVKNPEFLAWYATAHFMSKKHINHLCGDIRTEIKYLKDIDRRAKSTNNHVDVNTEERTAYYTGLLRVLEFTMNFCEITTNNILDYFSSAEEYAKKVSYFVDFSNDEDDLLNQLINFCNTKIPSSKSGVIGLYYDAANPIVNKNVVRATMYGRDSIFENGVVENVNKDAVLKYYDAMRNVESIFMKDTQRKNSVAILRTDDEQRKIRSFQDLKNSVELTDVSAYVDIVNDLYGQLLSWVYLRERDMTYMQLGYHYVRLYWGSGFINEYDNSLSIDSNKSIEKGAVLYMLKAAYSHDMKMPVCCKKSGVNGFLELYEVGTYYAGMELFENITVKNNKIVDDSIHDEAQGLRNYIAHFKYFSKADHSIEELYGDVFSMMFAYNTNLRKSIPFVFKNIMAQNKLIADIEAVESDSTSYYGKGKEKVYSNTKWAIKKDFVPTDGKKAYKGLESDVLTFKVMKKGAKSSIAIKAHSQKFIDDVRKLYTYKRH